MALDRPRSQKEHCAEVTKDLDLGLHAEGKLKVVVYVQRETHWDYEEIMKSQ